MSAESLTVVDNRTGAEYELPIVDGAIHATEFGKIKGPDGAGLLSYDPAFLNTASCRSTITYIDGDVGILRYRGYPIEQVAEQAGFLETAYLVLEGELPTRRSCSAGRRTCAAHTYVHTNIEEFLAGFRYDAHPMGMLLGAVGALSTFYPDAKNIQDPHSRYVQRVRLIAKLPDDRGRTSSATAAASRTCCPRNDLDYIGNYVNMTFEIGGRHEPNPVLQRALEILLILHADHEQNCSTSAVRSVGSSNVDPFSAVSAGIAALYGPLHGGANEAVLRMLDEIGDVKNVPAFIEGVKDGTAGTRLMGFGHRVYKSYDPRAKLIKQVADSVFAETGIDPKLEIALELERIALEDEYFVSRKLYPNVDFYSGLIYKAMGYPDGLLHRPLRARPPAGLDRPVGGDAHRQRDEDRPAAAALRGRGRAAVRADGRPLALSAGGRATSCSPGEVIALPPPTPRQDEIRCRALAAQGEWRFRAGRGLQREQMDEAVALERSLPRWPLDGGPTDNLARQLVWSSEPEGARRVLHELVAAHRTRSDADGEATAIWWLSLLEWRVGDWEKAERYAAESYEIRTQLGRVMPTDLFPIAVVAAHRGRIEDARTAARRELAGGEDMGIQISQSGASWILGFSDLSLGDAVGALAHLRRAYEIRNAFMLEPAQRIELGDLLEALIGVDELGEADDVLTTWEPRARAVDRAWALAILARCRGLLLAARGDLDRAVESFLSGARRTRSRPGSISPCTHAARARPHAAAGEETRCSARDARGRAQPLRAPGRSLLG